MAYNRAASYPIPKQLSSVASWIGAAVGVWLIVAPWAWGYPAMRAAVLNDTACGIAAILIAVASALVQKRWPSWLLAMLGAWLLVAPFLLSYGLTGSGFGLNIWMRAVVNDLLVGGALVLFGALAAIAKPRS